MPVLVIADHDNCTASAATLSAIRAASKLGDDIHVLVAGDACDAVAAELACVEHVARVRLAQAAWYAAPTAEDLAALILALAGGYSHLLAPASSAGKNCMPRVAAKLGVSQISDVIAIEGPDTFVRPIYAGNALARVRSSDPVRVITVRPSAFDAVAKRNEAAAIDPVAAEPQDTRSRVLGRKLTKSARPELGAARIVVSGGRGLGSGENYRTVLEPLADALGAALGASRAAVDAGYVPNDFQVGQTGKIVAPELYVAAGISGAIQHLAGMKDSKLIVAINKDPDAPIFQLADYGLVADLFEAVPALAKALQS